MVKNPGERLGQYEIQYLLGAGGMGEVYLAEDRTLHRTVVLKVVSQKVAGDPDAAARLLREARAVAALDHPNICTLYEIGADAGIDYLALQYLPGETLADRIRHGPIPLDEAVGIAIDLTSALVYAHGRGVIHRDIKPQNVMVLPDGRAMLLDFGVAKTFDLEGRDTTMPGLTRDGTLIGTLEYMAPEQLAGQAAQAQSDLFSLALVVYEMVTGRHPFRADTAAMTVSAILTRDYPLMTPVLGPRFAALDGVLAKALSREARMRHETAAALHGDFERIRRPSLGAADASLLQRNSVRPHRALAVATIALALAAVAYVAFGPSTGLGAAVSRTLGLRGRSIAGPVTESTAAFSPRRAVEYWFDVRQAGGRSEILRSLGNEPFEPGSKFRITLSAPLPAFVYLLNDDAADLSLVYPLSAADSNAPPPAAIHTSDWFGFSTGAGVERLWIVWSLDRVASLDGLVPSANERDLGIVRDRRQATSIRQWLAMSQGRDVVEDRGSDPSRVMLSFATSPLVRQITLQHLRRSSQ